MSNQTPNPYTTKSYINPYANFDIAPENIYFTIIAAIVVVEIAVRYLVSGGNPIAASIMEIYALGTLILILGISSLYNKWLLTKLETDSSPTSIDYYGKVANVAEIGLPPEPNMSYEKAAKILEEEIDEQAEKQKNMAEKTIS